MNGGRIPTDDLFSAIRSQVTGQAWTPAQKLEKWRALCARYPHNAAIVKLGYSPGARPIYCVRLFPRDTPSIHAATRLLDLEPHAMEARLNQVPYVVAAWALKNNVFDRLDGGLAIDILFGDPDGEALNPCASTPLGRLPSYGGGVHRPGGAHDVEFSEGPESLVVPVRPNQEREIFPVADAVKRAAMSLLPTSHISRHCSLWSLLMGSYGHAWDQGDIRTVLSVAASVRGVGFRGMTHLVDYPDLPALTAGGFPYPDRYSGRGAQARRMSIAFLIARAQALGAARHGERLTPLRSVLSEPPLHTTTIGAPDDMTLGELATAGRDAFRLHFLPLQDDLKRLLRPVRSFAQVCPELPVQNIADADPQTLRAHRRLYDTYRLAKSCEELVPAVRAASPLTYARSSRRSLGRTASSDEAFAHLGIRMLSAVVRTEEFAAAAQRLDLPDIAARLHAAAKDQVLSLDRKFRFRKVPLDKAAGAVATQILIAMDGPIEGSQFEFPPAIVEAYKEIVRERTASEWCRVSGAFSSATPQTVELALTPA